MQEYQLVYMSFPDTLGTKCAVMIYIAQSLYTQGNKHLSKKRKKT